VQSATKTSSNLCKRVSAAGPSKGCVGRAVSVIPASVIRLSVWIDALFCWVSIAYSGILMKGEN
jgi:hypothetical protein